MGVEGVGVAELLELLKLLDHRLLLALADLYARDEGVDLDVVFDQGDLLRRELLLDGEEIVIVDVDCVVNGCTLPFFSCIVYERFLPSLAGIQLHNCIVELDCVVNTSG